MEKEPDILEKSEITEKEKISRKKVGEYYFIKEIGRGAFATVYKGFFEQFF